MDEWIKKIALCTHTVAFYLALQNKGMLFAGKLMEVEIIMLSEVNQTQTGKWIILSIAVV